MRLRGQFIYFITKFNIFKQEVIYEEGMSRFRNIRNFISNKDFDLDFYAFNDYNEGIVVDTLCYRIPKLV